MTTEEKLKLIKEVGEEIVTEKELKDLLSKDEQLVAYDGFEPSGQMHIAQGILRAININKLTQTGIKFKMLVADWHAMANKKMGGDLEKIKTVGKYFIEVWRATGMDMSNVEFVWASDLVKDSDYWKLVLQIAATNSINRFIRTAEIMGRFESDNLTAGQLIYPCMQIADIFTLGAKVTQLGMDQRKINVLAREIGSQLGYWKPVIVSHHMLLGLKGRSHIDQLKKLPKSKKLDSDLLQRALEERKTSADISPEVVKMALEQIRLEKKGHSEVAIRNAIKRLEEDGQKFKMSKSNPDSAIFMTDTEEDIQRKLTKAWCPEATAEENPVLEYAKYLIFESFDTMTIARPERFGGDISFDSYDALEKAYLKKEVHPQDLKSSVATHLNDLVKPVREHFDKNPYAKELLRQVQSYQITR